MYIENISAAQLKEFVFDDRYKIIDQRWRKHKDGTDSGRRWLSGKECNRRIQRNKKDKGNNRIDTENKVKKVRFWLN